MEGGHALCSQQGPDVPIMGSQQLVWSLQVLQGQKCPRPWDMQGMAPPTATHRLRAPVGAAWGLAPHAAFHATVLPMSRSAGLSISCSSSPKKVSVAMAEHPQCPVLCYQP